MPAPGGPLRELRTSFSDGKYALKLVLMRLSTVVAVVLGSAPERPLTGSFARGLRMDSSVRPLSPVSM